MCPRGQRLAANARYLPGGANRRHERAQANNTTNERTQQTNNTTNERTQQTNNTTNERTEQTNKRANKPTVAAAKPTRPKRQTACTHNRATHIAMPPVMPPGVNRRINAVARGEARPLPHLHRDWAHPLPHLHRDWAQPLPHLHRDSHPRRPPPRCHVAASRGKTRARRRGPK